MNTKNVSKIKNINKKGFTLIEVIIAISIVVILSSLTVPKVTAYIDRAKNTKIISTGKQIYTAAMWSYTENGSSFSQNKISEAINSMVGNQGTGTITSGNISVDGNSVTVSFNSGCSVTIDGSSNVYTVNNGSSQIFSSNSVESTP